MDAMDDLDVAADVATGDVASSGPRPHLGIASTREGPGAELVLLVRGGTALATASGEWFMAAAAMPERDAAALSIRAAARAPAGQGRPRVALRVLAMRSA